MPIKLPPSFTIDYLELHGESSPHQVIRHAAVLHIVALHQVSVVVSRFHSVFAATKFNHPGKQTYVLMKSIEKIQQDHINIGDVEFILKCNESTTEMYFLVEKLLSIVEDVDTMILDNGISDIMERIRAHMETVPGTPYERGFPKGVVQMCNAILNSLNEVEGMLNTLSDLEADVWDEDFSDLEGENKRLFKLIRQCDFLIDYPSILGKYDDLVLFKRSYPANYNKRYLPVRQLLFKVVLEVMILLKEWSSAYSKVHNSMIQRISEEQVRLSDDLLEYIFQLYLGIIEHLHFAERSLNGPPEPYIRRTVLTMKKIHDGVDEIENKFEHLYKLCGKIIDPESRLLHMASKLYTIKSLMGEMRLIVVEKLMTVLFEVPENALFNDVEEIYSRIAEVKILMKKCDQKQGGQGGSTVRRFLL